MTPKFRTIDPAATGRLIARLRDLNELPVEELSILLGPVSRQTLYRWMRGEALPSVPALVRLSDIFGLGMEDLLCFLEEKGGQNG